MFTSALKAAGNLSHMAKLSYGLTNLRWREMRELTVQLVLDQG